MTPQAPTDTTYGLALAPVDLETLDRLCEKGEFLIHPDCHFYPLESLIVARLAFVYEGFGPCQVVKPSAWGCQVARIRAELRKRILRDPPGAPSDAVL